MHKTKIALIVISLLILIHSTPLVASDLFIVTYTQETNILFKKGSDSPGYQTPPQEANKFVGLLGTMQINVQDPPTILRDPAILYTNGTTHFSFKGLRANPNPKESNFGFYIEIVTYLNGSSTPSYRAPATQRIVYLTNQNTINNLSSMKVEFYFVS